MLGALAGCGVQRELWVMGVSRSSCAVEREVVQRCHTAAAQSGGQFVVYSYFDAKTQPNTRAFSAPLDFK